MKTIFVRPAAGRQVLKADNTFFAAGEWAEVENSLYYRRRLADGDLELRPAATGKAVLAQAADKNKNDKGN